MVRRIAILGSTGSIGRSALSVIESHADRLQVVALAAGSNAALLCEQAERFRPALVSIASASALAAASAALRGAGTKIAAGGAAGLLEVATYPDADIVLCASSGTAALEAVLAAIEAGKTIALANKEVLVMAGGLMTEAARRRGVAILPVDSEHNAIHQCLAGRRREEVRRLVLTASGGPFRGRSGVGLDRVGPEDALQHPTWRMGRKITIDSATLMNKGLEVIEAHWLFNVPAEKIQVVVHPQSVIHSLVQYIDGSVLAELGNPDMRTPIAQALAYPERIAAGVEPLDLFDVAALHFERPDFERFPCLALAYGALRDGDNAPATLNAANEVAVQRFLEGRIGFVDIAGVIARVMERMPAARLDTLDDVLAADAAARRMAERIVDGMPRR